ncbi:MAG: sulfurtransferase TusA family protein [Deltaproteobacteria bacterium]|nr:sulfurtransferase TusA family protein [Deltaproteobacteria bacterium]
MEQDIRKHLNLHGVTCPMNFVRTKLALEELEPGEYLEVILDEGEPMLNVPRSLKEEGHRIIKVTPFTEEAESFRLIVEKR